MPTNEVLSFRPREFKGSRLRCLLATHRSRTDVARFLSELIGTPGSVVESDRWFPGGFLKPDEAKLGESVGLLNEIERMTITGWWLADTRRANTPNWDLASTCQLPSGRGLLLVEAKAHATELADDRCGATNRENFQRIEEALALATAGWNTLQPGFKLTPNSHYQMSNRFAFAWKLATMQVPVVLVYLGFLNAAEMTSKEILRDYDHWEYCVLDRSDGVVPRAAWNRTFDVSGTPLTVLIRAATVHVEATVEGHQ